MSNILNQYLKNTQGAQSKTDTRSPHAEKHFRHDEEIILNFLHKKDVPSWFRGISKFQITAANNLFNALRDDCEQQTTHRVRACIGRIGLNPSIPIKDVKVLMRLCRGNDLAFLWFLWELHYKSGLKNSYNVNEQLIFSIIAHLDMITTLRELDRVLPPPQRPKKEIVRQQRLEELKNKKTGCGRKYKPQYISPYFERLTRPKPYGKSLTIDIPDFMVSFGFYENYLDKNYVVSNESNRWYGGYKMQISRRIINNIINEEIGCMFEDYTNAAHKADGRRNVCEHHKVIEELEKNLETELRIIARDHCLQLTDTVGKRKEAKRKRIAQQIERDVAKYMCKFRKVADHTRRVTLCHVLSSECAGHALGETNSACDCTFLDFDYGTEEDICEEMGASEHGSDQTQNKGDGVPAKSNEKAEKEEGSKVPENAQVARHQGMGDTAEDEKQDHSQESQDEDNGKKNNVKCKTRLTKSKPETRNSRASDANIEYMKNYDYGHYDPVSPTESQAFFQAPQEHNPYQFEYRKVFSFKNNTEEKINIKKAFVEALDSSAALTNRSDDAPIDYSTPVNKCVHDIWNEQVAKKNEEIRRAEEEEKARLATKEPLNYDMDYFDPEDANLMHNMLKDALEYIAKDTKFVLASMPEASKLPFLREWIYQRYGKLYTREARYRELQVSIKIFRALDKITQDVPMPQIKMLGNQLYVDYSCRDYLIKKANYIKKKYYDRLDANIMEQARVFWFAMRPYLCSNGPPRNTYFAYMPSRVLDITRFRLWKTTEFMDAKRAWDKRRLRASPTN